MSISTILFICTGNTCRSPMAEALAQNWLNENGHTDWVAISAGTFAQEGAPANPNTVDALSRNGIVFEGRSTPLSEEMAKKADLIICMAQSHLEVVLQFVDTAELLSPDGSIADPIGQDQSVYDELAEQMEQLIKTKLESIIH